MLPADQRVLCDWRDNYGQSVPQVTVRNQSTKDNVGTLPLYSYTQPAPTPQPLTFMTWNSLDTSNANDSTDLSTAVVLFQCETALVVKPSLLAQLSHLHVCNSSPPFYLRESSPLPYSKMNLSRTCLTLTFIFRQKMTFLFSAVAL